MLVLNTFLSLSLAVWPFGLGEKHHQPMPDLVAPLVVAPQTMLDDYCVTTNRDNAPIYVCVNQIVFTRDLEHADIDECELMFSLSQRGDTAKIFLLSAKSESKKIDTMCLAAARQWKFSPPTNPSKQAVPVNGLYARIRVGLNDDTFTRYDPNYVQVSASFVVDEKLVAGLTQRFGDTHQSIVAP